MSTLPRCPSVDALRRRTPQPAAEVAALITDAYQLALTALGDETRASNAAAIFLDALLNEADRASPEIP
jgi:hypothetical protein